MYVLCVVCVRSMEYPVEYSIRLFASDSHSDLLPYFPDPDTRSSQHCHRGSSPFSFGDLLFGTDADTILCP